MIVTVSANERRGPGHLGYHHRTRNPSTRDVVSTFEQRVYRSRQEVTFRIGRRVRKRAWSSLSLPRKRRLLTPLGTHVVILRAASRAHRENTATGFREILIEGREAATRVMLTCCRCRLVFSESFIESFIPRSMNLVLGERRSSVERERENETRTVNLRTRQSDEHNKKDKPARRRR